MQNQKLSLVIPAYNEEEILGETIKTALAFLDTQCDGESELIVSDDGSTDRTRAIAQSAGDTRVRVVSHMPNRGKGSAVREGVLAATGDVIVCTDADLAYGLAVVPGMLTLLSGGADIVAGSRELHPEGYADYPFLRLAASRTFHFITGRMSGFAYDTQCGIKAYSRAAAQAVFTRCQIDGFAFDFEVLMLADKLGLRVVEYPVKIVNHRDSKVHVLRDSVRMFRDIRKITRSVKERFD
ncbi:MAG: glycosyltransferase [Oscillospiraceae bacterium]|jgi:dolichyl-phosphate beta-glucosyltransferase